MAEMPTPLESPRPSPVINPLTHIQKGEMDPHPHPPKKGQMDPHPHLPKKDQMEPYPHPLKKLSLKFLSLL